MTKSLAAGTVRENGRTAFLRTRVLDEDDLADLRGVEHTCHLVQRWADKAYEARVVVIGPTTTGVAIRARSAAAHVDWLEAATGEPFTARLAELLLGAAS